MSEASEIETPTTDDVRTAFATDAPHYSAVPAFGRAFDRWLAEHDREVREAQLESVRAVIKGRDVKFPERFAFLASDNYVLGYRDALQDMRKALEGES
jgi:hypothetical protein